MSRKIIEVLDGMGDISGVEKLCIGDVIIYPQRAVSVFGKIYSDAVSRAGFFRHVYADVYAPQRIYFPFGTKCGDKEHRLWLLFAVMTDRRGQSNRIYLGHQALWRKYPELYSIQVLNFPIQKIVDLISNEAIGLHRNIIENWSSVAETIFLMLEGEPLNIYRNRDINSIVYPRKSDTVLHLPGFGPKILSLLSMFYSELNLMELPFDAFPVDVHVQRIAITNGILDSKKGTIPKSIAETVLRYLICQLSFMKRWSKIDLSNALWLLGNRGCSGCYRSAIMSHFCPVYQFCTGAIDSGPYYGGGNWDLTRRFRKSGGSGKMFSEEVPLIRILNSD